MTTNSKVVSKKVQLYGVIVIAAAIIILTAAVTSEVLGQVSSTESKNTTAITSTTIGTNQGRLMGNVGMMGSMMNETAMRGMLERGNIAMGFNQSKIMHHFTATPTGGEIMIVALNSSDNNTIKQIRNHVLDIQKEFSQGNFTKPFFIHAQQVPGTKLMAEKKDLIRYSIKQINDGSILLLTTNDQQLIAAIHQFIAFQTAQHSGH
jgi:hypothetical protein